MPHQEEPGWPLAHCGFDIEGVAKLGGGFCRVILWSDSFFYKNILLWKISSIYKSRS